jgi:hypothetical protein
VSPRITLPQAEQLPQRHWPLTGRLTELGSFADQN